VTDVPVAPGPQYEFRVPPGWPAPPGFDPRRGYRIDPTWPAPPPGWVFWGRPVVPVAARTSSIRGSTVLRLVIGLVVLVFVVTHFVGGSDAGTHVGSCWKHVSGTEYAPVDCSSSNAEFRVVSEVSDMNQCPGSSDSYLDSGDVGAADRYRCLVPATHA